MEEEKEEKAVVRKGHFLQDYFYAFWELIYEVCVEVRQSFHF